MSEKDLNTEKTILKAAEEVFLKKGYAAAKTTEIAKLAGVNHAMLHYYFRTKENLFDIVFREKAKLMADSFLSEVNTDKPFIEMITKAISLHFDFVKANPTLPFFVVGELSSNEKSGRVWKDVALPVFKRVIVKIDEAMSKEIKKGTIRNMKTLDFIISVISLNVFVFTVQPLVKDLINVSDEEFASFLEERKKENIRLALLALKP